MAKIRLDLSQFKASGVYTIEFDASESIILNTQTTRLVVGFSKRGPINAPVFCNDVKTARRIFGDIDKDLENKGAFFHRSLFTCLETGPCFALNLMPLNNDTSTPNADYDVYKSYSLSVTEANGVTASELYSSYFNKERFYFPDTSYFLANVNADTSANKGKLFNFVNLGQTPFSIIIRKSGSLTGFNVTARDWFGAAGVPTFMKEFDYISDYFVNVDIVAGNWTDFATLSVDPVFSQFFDSKGIIKSKLDSFLNAPDITRIGSFQGSIIPDLVDNNGINYSIDTIVNAGLASTGLFCALNRAELDDYDPNSVSAVGRVDMIGHSLINSSLDTIDFLSYNFSAKEFFDYTQNSTHTSANNTYVYDLGTGATSNLPEGLGSTGASYSASANGYNENDPNRAAYFESFYGSGNQGKFNNVLVLRKEAFSTTQYGVLSTLNAGGTIALRGAAGATQYATITTINEVTVGSDVRLKLGIAHPLKQTEGTTVGKNAAVLAVGASYMVVGGTAANTDLNPGDWIFAENTGLRYYFRATSASLTGSNTKINVDVTNSEFGGSTNIANVTTFYTVYWESINGVAGSLFDVVENTAASSLNSFTTVKEPDIFNYTSVAGGQSYYLGYEYSPIYEAFDQGILTDGDKAYVAGPTPLYLSASFGNDTDAVKTITLKAYYDSSLSIGYTGSWTFNNIVGSTGATFAPTALRIYSLVGDYSSSIGATGFNTNRTTCYIAAADEGKVQVDQFLVADPLNTGNPADYLLTRVISKKKISSGTFNGYYQINVNQRLATYGDDIIRYRAIQEAAPGYQPTYLSGFKVTSYHLPNGSNSQLAKILGMLDPANSNIAEGLSSRHIIAFRYIVDTFNGGLNTQSYPKNIVTNLAKKRQKCMAIMNAPSISQFVASTDPRFTEPPTAVDPKPLLNTRYISEGGNLSLGPSFTYSLPDEENGAKFAGFFAPFLTLRENNKNINVPPAADVSNNFIRKFINGQPYSIVAGPRRGVLSNPKLVGLEYDFTDTDRGYLEPFGWNPIVFRRGIGFMIFGNQSAYQRTPSAFNNLHVRDLLITIEEAIEDVLQNFLFEFNDASTRLQIKSIVDAYLDNVRSGGGIYEFETVMNESNNTPDIIDQNFAIIDVGIEPARGAQKFINRITVLKTGGISSGGFTVV
jgi:hypothetical protein